MEVLYYESGEVLEQLPREQSIPGDFQGEAGSGPGQPDLAVNVSVHCRGVGLNDL